MNGTPSTVNSGNPYRTGDHREQQEKLPEITTSTTGQGSLAGAALVLPANNKLLAEPAPSTPPSKEIRLDRTTICLTDSVSGKSRKRRRDPRWDSYPLKTWHRDDSTGRLESRDATVNANRACLTTTDSESISQCAAAIKQAFPLPPTEPTKESTADRASHFFYSNDYNTKVRCLDFPAMIATMAKLPETQSKSPRIGLVIGQSSLPDAAPEFTRHCDIVLVVDNDPLLLSSVKKRMDLLSGCDLVSSEKIFYEQLNSYIFYDLMNLQPDEIDGDDPHSIDYLNYKLSHVRKALGQYWAFSSQERLTEVREAVRKTHFIPVYGDIFSREFLKKMGDIFTSHNAEVHALNLTNVFEYHPKIKRNSPYDKEDTEDTIEKPSELANSLTICPQALIHSSRILRSNKGSRFDSPANHFEALDDLLIEDIENPHISSSCKIS